MKHLARCKGLMVCGIAVAAPAGAQIPAMSPAEMTLAAELRPIDQGLLNAITTGDRAAWARVVGPGFIYVAEDEQAIDGPKLLSLLVPPKPGDDGADAKPFKIIDYTVQLAGDTATVIHHDAEQGYTLGSRLTGVDVTTEVWQRLGGRWLLRLVHTTPIPTIPPAVSLTAADAASLAGGYVAAGQHVTVRAVADGIMWQAQGRPSRRLEAEARDVLFEPGNPRIRYIFQRDAQGNVTGVLRRNENRAVAYAREREAIAAALVGLIDDGRAACRVTIAVREPGEAGSLQLLGGA